MALFDQLQELQTFVHYSSLSKHNLFSIITVGETLTDCDSLESFRIQNILTSDQH